MNKYGARRFALKNRTQWFLAQVSDGTFLGRSNGDAIFASTETRLSQLVEKARGTTTTLPENFAGWVTASAPAPRQEGFRPFGQQGANRARASRAEAVRTPAQCRALLALVVKNATRCLNGEIGGDLDKYAKGVVTALASYRSACGVHGVPVDDAAVAAVEAFRTGLLGKAAAE